ncbi:MAG: alpha/beta hydrolase [Kangiellaceae bacterium]|nr:alpha/beta hydrolase [Kangiellaceae bacterium]
MLRLTIIFVLSLLPVAILNAKEPEPYKLPRTEVIPIQESKTKKQYELYIKLPEEYSKNKNKKYPVIYFTDAVWHIEILSAATAFLMEDVILVGISWQKDIEEQLLLEEGPQASRYRDYSISKSSKPEVQSKYQLGQANKHLNFVRKDVFEYVERHYRTAPNNRTYFGYSLGGLFGAYTLVVQPDTFNNYILGSPSLWKGNPKLSLIASNHLPHYKDKDVNIFISYGELEQKLSVHIETFITLLKEHDLHVHRLVVESSDHGTAFPTTGIESIRWLSDLEPNSK